nr:MAG TPA: hypothetical protein [Caudoviricetes sp.]
MSGRSPRWISVKRGTPLGDMELGTLVKLNENGTPVEFYVACHNYEAGLNDNGRTLVVRKDSYDERVFSNSNNDYASSSLDAFLTGPYFNLLDAGIREKAGTTKFYYTSGYTDTVTTLERAVFQLSHTELGRPASYANTEGTALPIASTLQIAHRNGAAVEQWTRSPRKNTNQVCFLYQDGYVGAEYYNQYKGSRPAFTLPASTLVGDDQLIA